MEHLNIKTIDYEQGWAIMEKGITKLKRILEGLPEPPFNSNDHILLYSTIYNLKMRDNRLRCYQRLQDNYKQVIVDYINSNVLPALRGNHGESMLRELVKRWENHKQMVKRLSHWFNPIDYEVVDGRIEPTPLLTNVGLSCFYDMIHHETNSKVKDAVKDLIDEENEDKQIDRALLKNVVEMYTDMGKGKENQKDYSEIYTTLLALDLEAHLKIT